MFNNKKMSSATWPTLYSYLTFHCINIFLIIIFFCNNNIDWRYFQLSRLQNMNHFYRCYMRIKLCNIYNTIYSWIHTKFDFITPPLYHIPVVLTHVLIAYLYNFFVSLLVSSPLNRLQGTIYLKFKKIKSTLIWYMI